MFKNLHIFIFLLIPISAYPQSEFNGFDVSNSIIPKNEIFSGGPPKDGIPAILKPKFISADRADWIKDNDLVAGVISPTEIKAYPLRILVWHELVNDEIDGKPILVTYCPLCGSIIVFYRNIDDKVFTFGVSGLLYQSDVLFYDHQTDSLWSQLKLKAISGKNVNKGLEITPYILSSWKEWKLNYPDTLVLSKETGYLRNYDKDPYSSYYTSRSIMFPVNNTSDRLHPKEKVLIVINGDVSKAYPFKKLSKNITIKDKLGSEEIIINSNDNNFIEVRTKEEKIKEYLTAYWFAWYAFKPDTLVFE